MNERDHWNKIAPDYNDEIFNVFASDRKGILSKYLKRHARKSGSAIDFGCGNGKAFPLLVPAFRHVLGLDISTGLLKQAKARGYSNVTLRQADLTRKQLKLNAADFVFCCNVIMFPDLAKNRIAFKNVAQSLKPGGTALLVLPSLDSALFSSWRLIDIYEREGVSAEEIPTHEFHYFKGSKRSIIQGIVHIDGVPTKHYSASELEVILPESGLTITALEKIEYEWNSELADPPGWLKAPYPWDWLVECRKN